MADTHYDYTCDDDHHRHHYNHYDNNNDQAADGFHIHNHDYDDYADDPQLAHDDHIDDRQSHNKRWLMIIIVIIKGG